MANLSELEIAQLPLSLQNLIKWVESSINLTPSDITNLVEKANLKPEELLLWADFNHDINGSYGRKLIYFNGIFEMLVMSWNPGDFSGIHDHGYANWGTVQVFGSTEHATLSMKNNKLTTTKRWVLKPNETIQVNRKLIHLMGNNTNERYLTFHIYGNHDLDQNYKAVTVDARIFNFDTNKTEFTDNGIFFLLDDSKINRYKDAPETDYVTWLRNEVELLRRIMKIEKSESINLGDMKWSDLRKKVYDKIENTSNWDKFRNELMEIINHDTMKVSNSKYWDVMWWELKEAAKMQRIILEEKCMPDMNLDNFQDYSLVYDQVICKPCFNEFTKDYIDFVESKYCVKFNNSSVISIGSGTGFVEDYLIIHKGVKKDNLLGIDISDAMVKIASTKINSKVTNIKNYYPNKQWDIIYSGLNAIQYILPKDFPMSVKNLASITKTGGIFFSDLITPDHIHLYPNVIETNDVISLRRPQIIEKDGYVFQESEILNISRLSNRMAFHYNGFHRRYLPSIREIYTMFKKEFGGPVELFDVKSLEKIIIDDIDDVDNISCPSTRYLIVAKKM